MRYWSVYCMEHDWPGLWRIWEERQIVSLGWPPSRGYSYEGKGKVSLGWTMVKNRLRLVQPGDKIVARLPDHRIGRIGDVLKVAPRNDQWSWIVHPSERHPDGEQGRIITVRWDFSLGPNGREYACSLPEKLRMKGAQLLTTMSELTGREFGRLTKVLSDSKYWVPVFAHKFRDEGALSDFIAAHPERIESGMRVLPMGKVREASMKRAGFSDVRLQDKDGNLVIVECKQGTAKIEHVKQLRRYMKFSQSNERNEKIRGLLVFSGAPAVTRDVWAFAQKRPRVELLAYRLDVQFQVVR